MKYCAALSLDDFRVKRLVHFARSMGAIRRYFLFDIVASSSVTSPFGNLIWILDAAIKTIVYFIAFGATVTAALKYDAIPIGVLLRAVPLADWIWNIFIANRGEAAANATNRLLLIGSFWWHFCHFEWPFEWTRVIARVRWIDAWIQSSNNAFRLKGGSYEP